MNHAHASPAVKSFRDTILCVDYRGKKANPRKIKRVGCIQHVRRITGGQIRTEPADTKHDYYSSPRKILFSLLRIASGPSETWSDNNITCSLLSARFLVRIGPPERFVHTVYTVAGRIMTRGDVTYYNAAVITDIRISMRESLR